MARGTVIFAGGGTGGHLFPGIAIADLLRARAGDSLRTEFWCSDRPLDRGILEREGRVFRVLPARPFSLRPRGLAGFLGSWGSSVRTARAWLREARARGGAVHLVAMGGFVAAPATQASRVERVPITLVNLDAVPGRANRWIARHASTVVTAPVVPDRPGWHYVGPIVRADAVRHGTPRECRARLGIDPDLPTLLVTGGSQGARSINRLLIALARGRSSCLAGWQVLHQSGPGEEGEVERAYRDAGIACRVAPFVDSMGDWWGAADLAIARAGAGNVAEAWCNRVPCVFLPYPYHRDRHQRVNAAPLVECGGARVCDDLIDPERNLPEAGSVIEGLMSDRPALERMRAALSRLPAPDGADRVGDHLLRALTS